MTVTTGFMCGNIRNGELCTSISVSSMKTKTWVANLVMSLYPNGEIFFAISANSLVWIYYTRKGSEGVLRVMKCKASTKKCIRDVALISVNTPQNVRVEILKDSIMESTNGIDSDTLYRLIGEVLKQLRD